MLAGSSSSHLLNLKCSSAIFFPQSSTFQLGNKDLKPRTGNWRVLQILFTINLAVWVAVLILHWLGLGSLGLSSWDLLSIAFLVTLFYSVFSLAYLHLYRMPQKKSSQSTS